MTLPDDSMHSEPTSVIDGHIWTLNPTNTFNETILLFNYNYSSFNYEDENFDYTNFVVTFYKTAVPIMLFFCVLSIVINLIIVASVRWLRHMTPNQCFSISLALADAYASLVIGLALLINSLLTVVHRIHLGLYYQCGALTLEALRMAGMMSSILHLLALAINHYISIKFPVGHALKMTRKTTMLCIITMWTLPLLFYFIYFSSLKGRAYQSQYCENYNFLGEFPYRLVTAIIFFVPLLLMAFLYGHIFVLVKKHQQGILQSRNRKKLIGNVKAIHTTLLILGTYLIGWMPAVVFFLMTCVDCRYSFLKLPPTTVISVTFTINTLIIIKSLVDPIIYAARVNDIQEALVRMRCACFGQIYEGRIKRSRQDDNGSSVRSRTDTTGSSMRLQSTYGNRNSELIYQKKDLVKENGC